MAAQIALTCSADLSFSYLYLPTVCSPLCHPFSLHLPIFSSSDQSSLCLTIAFPQCDIDIVVAGLLLPNWRNKICFSPWTFSLAVNSTAQAVFYLSIKSFSVHKKWHIRTQMVLKSYPTFCSPCALRPQKTNLVKTLKRRWGKAWHSLESKSNCNN